MIVVNICLTICTEQMSVMILVENLIGEITFDTLDPPGAQFVESPFGHIFLFAEYTPSLGNPNKGTIGQKQSLKSIFEP